MIQRRVCDLLLHTLFMKSWHPACGWPAPFCAPAHIVVAGHCGAVRRLCPRQGRRHLPAPCRSSCRGTRTSAHHPVGVCGKWLAHGVGVPLRSPPCLLLVTHGRVAVSRRSAASPMPHSRARARHHCAHRRAARHPSSTMTDFTLRCPRCLSWLLTAHCCCRCACVCVSGSPDVQSGSGRHTPWRLWCST